MYQNRNIYYDLKRYSEQYAENVAIVDAKDGCVTTYSELWRKITAISGNLKRCDVKRGETILAILDNSPMTLQLMLACMISGINYAPIACNSTLVEVKRFISIAKPKYALIENTVNDAIVSSINNIEIIDIDSVIEESEYTDNLLEAECGEIYIGTSGTTGEPKIIRIDANCLWSSGYNFLKLHHKIDTASRFYNILPMSYLGGIFNLGMAPLSCGASVVIDDVFSGTSFLDFWQKVERFKINSLWLVPTIVRGLLEISTRIERTSYAQYPKVDVCFLGTAPISLDIKTSFEKLTGIPVLENYGLSETTFISTETIDSNNLRKEGSVGSILPWVKLKIKSINNRDGNSILVKTPTIMLGYLGGDSVGEIDKGEWFDTKDYGYIDDCNILVLQGRGRDIIKKGGVMLALREIELLTESNSDVDDVCAFAIEHSFYGESYNLYVVSSVNIDSWLHEQLSYSKWPEKIIYLNKLPRTRAGKIDKKIILT